MPSWAYAPRWTWTVRCPVCRTKLDWRRDVTEAAKAKVEETMHVDCPKHGAATVRLEWEQQNRVA